MRSYVIENCLEISDNVGDDQRRFDNDEWGPFRYSKLLAKSSRTHPLYCRSELVRRWERKANSSDGR